LLKRIPYKVRRYKVSVSEPPVFSLESFTPLLLLLVLSLAALIYHLIRISFNEPVDFSMDWNLFLSWIPLLIAFLTNRIARFSSPKPWLIGMLSFLWLLFFPNAPYMITDLVHLSVDYARDLTWHDVIMLFYYADVSLINGLVSMYWVHTAWLRTYSKPVSNMLLVISLVLAGVGVYLGRILRLNSWDVLSQPKQLLKTLTLAFGDRTALVLSVEFGLLLGVLYLVLWYLLRFRIRRRSI
jgi:uncharacterized membrane protein